MYSFVHFKISPPHIVYGGEKSKTIKNLMRNVASCYIFTNLSVSDLIENSWILISVTAFSNVILLEAYEEILVSYRYVVRKEQSILIDCSDNCSYSLMLYKNSSGSLLFFKLLQTYSWHTISYTFLTYLWNCQQNQTVCSLMVNSSFRKILLQCEIWNHGSEMKFSRSVGLSPTLNVSIHAGFFNPLH